MLGADLPAAVLAWFSWCDGVADAPGQTMNESGLLDLVDAAGYDTDLRAGHRLSGLR
ncbi:hypothetical protein OHA21_12600 [Actinoplanes sp. NBC_00393]|uniref:hypothetical protein n=1 Tax=Actinoplanes sp. NBC_00393 TaxID=2975953 RepID=UPI002E1EF33F